MRTRIATADDLEFVTQLRIAFLADHRKLDPTAFSPAFVADTRAFFDTGLATGRTRSILAVAEGDAACIGIVSYVLDERPPQVDDPRTLDALLLNMYVVPHRRSEGVGRELLDAALEDAAEQGARTATLIATDLGRPLYESVGFATSDIWLQRPVDAP